MELPISNSVEINQSKPQVYNGLSYWLKQILIAVLICALLLVIFNQGYAWYYKNEFLQTPCELCVSLNPEWEQCYEFSKKKIIVSSPQTNYTPTNWSNILVNIKE